MATKSKSRSISARRSSPRTRSGAVPESNSSPRTCSGAVPEPNTSPRTRSSSVPKPNSSPRTRSGAVPEPNSSPHTCSGALLKPNFSPGTSGFPRTPFSFGAITPIGTLKSVSLSDWWLTKNGEEKGLCVTGFESKGGSEVRLFSSGAISKRHDSITLETFDGVTICISGFINRSRTLQNRISSDVCNRFLLGFPYNWKDYEEEEEESIEKKNVEIDFNISFDDIPMNRLQDLSLLEGCLKSKILDHVVDSLRDFTCPSTQKSDKESEKSRMCDDESVVPSVVGVKTRGMLKRKEEDDTLIEKRVNAKSKKKKRSREKK